MTITFVKRNLTRELHITTWDIWALNYRKGIKTECKPFQLSRSTVNSEDRSQTSAGRGRMSRLYLTPDLHSRLCSGSDFSSGYRLHAPVRSLPHGFPRTYIHLTAPSTLPFGPSPYDKSSFCSGKSAPPPPPTLTGTDGPLSRWGSPALGAEPSLLRATRRQSVHLASRATLISPISERRTGGRAGSHQSDTRFLRQPRNATAGPQRRGGPLCQWPWWRPWRRWGKPGRRAASPLGRPGATGEYRLSGGALSRRGGNSGGPALPQLGFPLRPQPCRKA